MTEHLEKFLRGKGERVIHKGYLTREQKEELIRGGKK